MSTPQPIGLTTDHPGISLWQLNSVARQLNAYLPRFASAWGASGYVTAYATRSAIPSGVWPVVVTANVPDGALGIHMDDSGNPYAVVMPGVDWSITASHEICEMLADPFGVRTFSGPSIRPADNGKVVAYLAEPCDPCEARYYRVGPYFMSDFVTPRWYSSLNATGSADLMNFCVPRQLLDGGYVSWMNRDTEHWWQAFMDGGKLSFSDLGVFTGRKGTRVAEWIDSQKLIVG